VNPYFLAKRVPQQRGLKDTNIKLEKLDECPLAKRVPQQRGLKGNTINYNSIHLITCKKSSSATRIERQ